MPSQVDLVTKVFDAKAPSYAGGYEGASSAAHSFVIRRDRVYEMIANRSGGRVLDIGCGPGVTAAALVARGFDFYGVDISPAMIEECNRLFGGVPSAHFAVGTIERMDFADSFFDVVIAMGVVEYIEDDDAAIREMARVLKPGGSVVISLPNRNSPFRFWQRHVYDGIRRVFRALRGRRPAPEIVHREYLEREYRARLETHGLAVSDVVYYNFKVMLFPFDRWFPRLTVATSAALERLGRGPLRWLGTGLLVRAEKTTP